MNEGKTVFSQIMEFLPLKAFHRCVKKYKGEYKVKKFTCLDQFLSMAFAQLTFRDSLRDIEVCLRSQKTTSLSYGLSQYCFAKHLSKRKRTKRLAYLC